MKSCTILSIVFLFAIYSLTHKAFCQIEYNSNRWLGKSHEKKLAKNFDWFRERYNSYKPDSSSISELKTDLSEYSILVFAGVWCGDSKRILPQFFKTMDEVKMPQDKVTLYLLDENKQSPQKLEMKYSITSIPTFILLKKGRIKGKIEEADITIIEKDLVNVISKVNNQ